MKHNFSILETCKMCPHVWLSGEQRSESEHIYLWFLFFISFPKFHCELWELHISSLLCLFNSISLKCKLMQTYLFWHFYCFIAVCVDYKEVSLLGDCRKRFFCIMFAIWLNFHTKWKAVIHYLSNILLKQWKPANAD